MKVAAFLPVKGQSERVPSKNLRLLDGKPLFLHSLEKLLSCSAIDEVFLDTESARIRELAAHLGCKFLHRRPELASNRTCGNRLFLNEVKHVEADVYIQLLATSPFIRPETIHRAVDILREQDAVDSVVLVRKEKQYTWDQSGRRPHYDFERIPNSKDLPDTVIETMGLYAVRRQAALRTQRRIGDAPYLLEASAIEAIDVNWEDDFELAQRIQAGLREQQRARYQLLQYRLTSALFSDILDELGHTQQVARGLSLNLEGRRLLGRAATLKLRLRSEGQDVRGIYSALESYAQVTRGDVLVIENEAPEYAYFGELNANLAIRAGAEGAIIGGQTRDDEAVRRLGFPVFASGRSCQDVRGRAVLHSINKPIQLRGVCVCPGDLVFGDAEGVVVIPRSIEETVLQRARRALDKEHSILREIAEGRDPTELLECYGEF